MNKIEELENRNADLAREILLNESAVYESKTEISNLDEDLRSHPAIISSLKKLVQLIDQLEKKNDDFKMQIYKNNLEIKRLKGNG